MLTAKNALIALIALAVAALAGAGVISWSYWSPRLQAAETRATRAEADAERDRKAANDTADLAQRQSVAINDLADKLRKAEEDARLARLEAQQKRRTAEAEAQQTLAETDPPGASDLEAVRAAEAAFDAELARERTK
ncbi:hypothetical protein [Geminicoccus flavidas]|uniref:hypothetical protein n=1 Tax=Geminicoccus flavidas TaxID=2506407 RepID=UPI00135782AA|nr:hypothetical protein [Geminicoccus flavidas]